MAPERSIHTYDLIIDSGPLVWRVQPCPDLFLKSSFPFGISAQKGIGLRALPNTQTLLI